MKRLKEEFNKNAMRYKIIGISPKRSRYLAEVYSLETGILSAIETGRIITRPDRIVYGRPTESSESLICNEKFGHDPLKCEGAWNPKNKRIAEERFRTACSSE